MAHRITSRPLGIILSSALQDIGISVDGTYVDVTLTGPGGVLILSERYYAYGSSVTLYDIATLIETEMMSSGHTTANYTLRVFTDTVTNKADSLTFQILYCDRFALGNDVSLFLRENFLTTLSARRVAPGSTLSIFLYAEKGESLQYSVNYRFRSSHGDIPPTALQSACQLLPVSSLLLTISFTLNSTGHALNPYIHRPSYLKFRRPSRYFRVEI